MQNREQLDEIVKSSFKDKSHNIYPPMDMFKRINERIESGRSDMLMSEKKFLNSFSSKKVAAAVVLTVFILAGTVFAASYISKYVEGYATEKVYENIPSREQLKKDVGFEAKMLDSLPGGYKFDGGDLAGYINGLQEAKNEKRKSVCSIYKKNKNEDNFITLTASLDKEETRPSSKVEKVDLDGADGIYWDYDLLIVNSEYKLSPEELQLEKKGSLSTVYVSSKKDNEVKPFKKLKKCRSLKWKDGKSYYVLTDHGYGLSRETLTEMAREIIKKIV